MNNRLSENEKAFVECFSRFVNGQMGSASKVGNALADDHRYLINEKGKVVFAFLERLANDKKVVMTSVTSGCADWQQRPSNTLKRTECIAEYISESRMVNVAKNFIAGSG